MVGMTRQKAEKHLERAIEHREYLREYYVEVKRSPKWRNLDLPWSLFGNPFQKELNEIKNDLKEINERISKYERILK